MKRKKFLLNEKTKPLKEGVEIGVLSNLLQSLLMEEKYEMAAVVRDRIEYLKQNG